MGTNDDERQGGRNRPGWARAADIALRTVHIGTSGILLGGHVFDMPAERLLVWLYLTVASGVGLVASEVYHSWHWPYHGRGVLVLVKLALLALVLVWYAWRVPILVAALVIGAVGSHMPKRYRHWSFVHGRVID